MIEGDNVCCDEVSLKLRTEASKERNGHVGWAVSWRIEVSAHQGLPIELDLVFLIVIISWLKR